MDLAEVRSLARTVRSLASLRQNTIGWSFDEVPLKDESEPAACSS